MNEQSGIRFDVIERQLTHKDKNKIRRTYNHAEYWDERCKLMQWWSDYLDAQRSMGVCMGNILKSGKADNLINQ